jgi:hypothetical protein
METTQNIQVLSEVSPNPISESGKLLFLEENLKVFFNSPSIINLKHPRAKYFKALIESLNLDDNEGYLNNPLMRLQESERCAVYSNNRYITRAECDWNVAALEDNC